MKTPRDLIILLVITGLGVFSLFFALILSFKYAQSFPGNIVYPGGTTYLGEESYK